VSEPFFENRNSVVAPERLPIEDKERHAEDVVRSSLGLCLVASDGAGVAQLIAVGVGGHAETSISAATESGWSASNSRRKNSSKALRL
jgi:hypothetical protein